MLAVMVFIVGSHLAQKRRAMARTATTDGSAKAGTRYKAVPGKATFGPGELVKANFVPPDDSRRWLPTTEFEVMLSNAKRCCSGNHLHMCRVKIMYNDCFPMGKYREQVLRGEQGVNEINDVGLLWELCELVCRIEGVPVRICGFLAAGPVAGLYTCIVLLLTIYMVDTACRGQKDTSKVRLRLPQREHAAWLVSAAYVLPMAALHGWSFLCAILDIKGRTRISLQTSLFRKYMNSNIGAKRSIFASEMTLAIKSDCWDHAGTLMSLMTLLPMTGKFLVMIIFTGPSLW